jgi:DNA adenine methylase
MTERPNERVRPLLKWAGGKRQLLPRIRPFYPESFSRYWEPFLGSGAVFFDLYAAGRLTGHDVGLLDNNADLIACYDTVRRTPSAVIAALQNLAEEQRQAGSAHYYDVRDRRFNPARLRWAQSHGAGLRYTAEMAAMLIYLNRTGFNGLFRLNAAGAFNVPAGRYRTPKICDPENIRRVAAALNRPSVTLMRADFDRMLEKASAGDFIYIDPPYAPLSRTAQFTSYTAGGFGHDEQRRLRDVIVQLARRGCQILLSNSTASEIADLYERSKEAKEAGLRCYRIPARRAINSIATKRGPVMEFLITNIPRNESRGADSRGSEGSDDRQPGGARPAARPVAHRTGSDRA